MAYVKTPKGQLAFKERSELLSARQRSLFLLFDGKKTVLQILDLTKALNINQSDIDHLIEQGFVEGIDASGASTGATIGSAAFGVVVGAVPIGSAPVASANAVAPGETPAVPAPVNTLTSQERFARAWPLATQLTAGLGIRGFRLNLSIEGASGYDDLLALLPKIQTAVGIEKCTELERALKG